jgi:branched-chain amino acid transport system permease protein
MDLWVNLVLNGLSFGMLLFLLAAGLTVVMGLMGIINLAHGSFYALAAYIAAAVQEKSGSFMLALAAAAVSVPILGFLVQRLLRMGTARQQSRLSEELFQVLLTLGVMLMIADVTVLIWGGNPYFIASPERLAGAVIVGPLVFPVYRIFLVAVGLLVALLLWLVMGRTRLGAVVRAGLQDEEMVRGLGINMALVSAGVFAFGGLLAALGGVLGGPILGAYPGVDLHVLLLALVVVIVGGIGSLKGALVGSLFVGLADSVTRILLPEIAVVSVFLPMAIVLILKPEGLFPAR